MGRGHREANMNLDVTQRRNLDTAKRSWVFVWRLQQFKLYYMPARMLAVLMNLAWEAENAVSSFKATF